MSEAFHDLRRIFNHSITVGMVAEHLLSFDTDREAQQVNQILSDHNFDFAGVRRLGRIVGYVRRDALQEGTLENYLQEFPQTSLLPEGEGLAEAVRKLQNREPVFVHRSSVVWGIFTGADMNRTAPRLWVVGLVGILEAAVASWIRSNLCERNVLACLSPGRRKKVNELYNELRQHNVELDRLSCLQLADRLLVLSKQENLLPRLGFHSKSDFRGFSNKVVRLRDNLYHPNGLKEDSEVLDQKLAIILQIERLIASLDELGGNHAISPSSGLGVAP